MRYVVVGYGNIGAKRRQVLGDRCIATVDPCNPAADYASLTMCPGDDYDAAVLAVPGHVKIELLEYLLTRGKHALVEKALVFPDQETAERLLGLAQRHGAIWYTSYNFRFEPHVQGVKRLLEDRAIGDVYHARMFYGNGTAGGIAGTWRDNGLGVLEDMASHLIDLTGFVFGKFGSEFMIRDRCAHELRGVDHCVLATVDRQVVIECSFLSWRNRWSVEVVGSTGALHMEGLTKWGPSELIVQRRRFPSGVPEEDRDVISTPDPTWAADLQHFEGMVAAGQTSYANDLWLSRTILHAATAPLT